MPRPMGGAQAPAEWTSKRERPWYAMTSPTRRLQDLSVAEPKAEWQILFRIPTAASRRADLGTSGPSLCHVQHSAPMF